jgi:cytochrome c oxidase subunit IV
MTQHSATDHHEHHAPNGEGHHGHVVVPISLYLKVFAALMVLLVVTLLAAIPDLGPWNIVIAMTIAVAKALLVVLYFMHLRWSTKLVQLFAGAALYWLAILFVLTLNDYMSRQ